MKIFKKHPRQRSSTEPTHPNKSETEQKQHSNSNPPLPTKDPKQDAMNDKPSPTEIIDAWKSKCRETRSARLLQPNHSTETSSTLCNTPNEEMHPKNKPTHISVEQITQDPKIQEYLSTSESNFFACFPTPTEVDYSLPEEPTLEEENGSNLSPTCS